ncbi:MmgE/PrpD family protein [Sinosporangium siamense]|uniref:MmgE/PrpD N-terminal domain-containing protein n=1 Tax=Sinosporangium siamense TaxID=1367973 RepID=A0A919V6T3_9ACTN|nr:MmgE/PrpD family protein [Sinosporangium siamense]GII92793.1 hypothetical protein Ssi02_30240 [Sinosporangium siamense]
MTAVTRTLAAFAAEAVPGPAALAAARGALPGTEAPTRSGGEAGPDRAAAHWTACAVVHHAAAREATPGQAEHALAVGIEVALRLFGSLDGQVVGGWDPVGSAVRVGAAAAAARLNGLDAGHVARAIGIAATQAAGLAVVEGTALGAYQHKYAAGDGLQAAHLAGAGMTAPETGLEGRRGLFALLAPEADPAGVVQELGERWLVTEQRPGVPAPIGAAQWADAVAYAREALS